MPRRTPHDEPSAPAGRRERRSPGGSPHSLVSMLPRASLVRAAAPSASEAEEPDMGRIVVTSAAIVTVLVLGVLSIATIGAVGIERAERADTHAAQDLYGRIEVEAALLRHRFESERRGEIERLFLDAAREPDLEARRANASRLLALLVEESRARHERELHSEEALRHDLDAAVRALGRLEEDLGARQRDLEMARSTYAGRLASLFGA